MRKRTYVCAIVLALVSLTSGWPFSTVDAFHDDLAVASVERPLRERAAHRHGRLDALIREYAGRYRVDPALVKAVIHAESGFRTRVRSRRGARGLMQVMPQTGRAYGVRNLDDPEGNLRAGIRHLRYLLDRHGNNPKLALAAYNAGSTVVNRYGGVPPYPETRRYVARVLKYRVRYSARG
jgi:soluble lytic murein transglycosylase-like protein